jgi:hypothetical protein
MLNGAEIARGKDMYLPLRVDVSGKLKTENLLELHFVSPYKYMKANPLPGKWKGKMREWRTLRKPGTDFNNYLGAQPHYSPHRTTVQWRRN